MIPARSAVGPLYTDSSTAQHSCTASVLAGGSGLLLTAAHCVHGTGAGMTFVPGYDGTAPISAPDGIWMVDRAWFPPQWVRDLDPHYDYAILQVRDRAIKGRLVSLGDLVNGNALGTAAVMPKWITVPGYISGVGDAPISCTAPTHFKQGYPSFVCSGYRAGSSGSPWIDPTGADGTASVDGVIGGLHQGGCTDSTSYSSPFDTGVYVLEIRAMLGLPADDAPAGGDDDC